MRGSTYCIRIVGVDWLVKLSNSNSPNLKHSIAINVYNTVGASPLLIHEVAA